jgi:hypothetical protein
MIGDGYNQVHVPHRPHLLSDNGSGCVFGTRLSGYKTKA